MKRLRFPYDRELISILLFLLMLIAIDNFLLQSLQSPLALIQWIDKTAIETGDAQPKSAINPLLPSWFDSFIWVVFTLVLWGFKRRRFLIWPLIIYGIWITFWLIMAVLMLAANLWNPGSGANVLLSDAFLVWMSNVLIFAIWYWVLDHKNQVLFSQTRKKIVHFIFPQTLDPIPGWEKWTPGFVDYVFLSFNTSTAFGASDTIILSKRAKIVVILQACLSLILFAMIAARAINIIR